MSKFLSKNKFDIVSTALTLGLAALTKKLIDSRYTKATGNPPPKNPEDDNVPLGTVILYTTATAVASVTAKILIRKILTDQWKRMDGELPDHLD